MGTNQFEKTIKVFEFVNDNGQKTFAYSEQVDEVGFSYYIITTDEENKPKIERINNAMALFANKQLIPVVINSAEYIKFINVYAFIQRQNKALKKTSEKVLKYVVTNPKK